MLRNKGLILFALLVLIMLLVPFVHGDDAPGSHARMVRVTAVSGQAQISHQQASGYQNVVLNMPIVQGDIVRTGDDGWLEIQLENGSEIRLAPDAQLTFSVLSRFASGSTATDVNLDDGEASFAVVAGDDIGPFHVNVNQRVISLKRSSRFRVTSIPSDPLEVVVWRGQVSIFNREESREVLVQAQETLVVDPQDVGHYDLEKQTQVDELDDWANQRDQALIASRDLQAAPALYYNTPQYSNPPICTSCYEAYNPYAYGYDPFLLGYWGYSPFAFAGGFYPFGFNPWLFPPGFIVVGVPRPVRPPVGVRPPVPPAARAAVMSRDLVAEDRFDARMHGVTSGFTMSTDSNNRPVITNEHPAVQSLSIDRAMAGATASTTAVARVHPPVKIPTASQPQFRAVNGSGHPGPAVSAGSQGSRPRTVSPPPRSFGATSAPAAHAGGGVRR